MSNEIGLVRLVNRSSRTRPELIKICIINQVFRAATKKTERQTERDERESMERRVVVRASAIAAETSAEVQSRQSGSAY